MEDGVVLAKYVGIGRCILLFGRCHNLMGGKERKKERKIDHKTLAQVHVHVYNFGTC